MQLETLLPLGLALLCPISMLLMMRGASHGAAACHPARESEPAQDESAERRRARLLERRRAIDAELRMLRDEAPAGAGAPAPHVGPQPLTAGHDG